MEKKRSEYNLNFIDASKENWDLVKHDSQLALTKNNQHYQASNDYC